MTPLLPVEIVSKIISLSNIDVLDNINGLLSGIPVEVFRNKRKDPYDYFRMLTPDTPKLLHAMAETKTILVQSRAAGYFYPDACSNSSPWIFLSPGSPLSVIRFGVYLEELGMKLQRSKSYTCSSYRIHTEGPMNNQHVKLAVSHRSQLSAILRFDSSIEHCFIAGAFAVSLFNDIHRQNRFWCRKTLVSKSTLIHQTTDNDVYDTSVENKYISRGFTKIAALSKQHAGKRVPLLSLSSLMIDFKHFTGFIGHNMTISNVSYLRIKEYYCIKMYDSKRVPWLYLDSEYI